MREIFFDIDENGYVGWENLPEKNFLGDQIMPSFKAGSLTPQILSRLLSENVEISPINLVLASLRPGYFAVAKCLIDLLLDVVGYDGQPDLGISDGKLEMRARHLEQVGNWIARKIN